MSTAPRILLVTLALSCTKEAEVPASCDAMCDAAAALYGGCLADWGLDWTAAGYDDEAAFENSCQTWGWQMTILQDAALEDGLHSEPGWLASTCTEREAAMSAEDAPCSAFTGIDWSDVPWDPADTGG
jgi:hypothetical protein